LRTYSKFLKRQLFKLITRRSEVQILSPQPKEKTAFKNVSQTLFLIDFYKNNHKKPTLNQQGVKTYDIIIKINKIRQVRIKIKMRGGF